MMNRKYPDPIKGDKFGRLTYTGEWEYKKVGIKRIRNRKYLKVICDCGKEVIIAEGNLLYNVTSESLISDNQLAGL